MCMAQRWCQKGRQSREATRFRTRSERQTVRSNDQTRRKEFRPEDGADLASAYHPWSGLSTWDGEGAGPTISESFLACADDAIE